MSTDVQNDRTLSDQIAEEIRVLLTRRRMSGRELARRLDVSPGWVSYRLTGEQEIGVNDLQRIAAVLGVSISDLLPRPARKLTDEYGPGERVIARVGETRKSRPAVRTAATTRAVRQTRPTSRLARPSTAVAVGR